MGFEPDDLRDFFYRAARKTYVCGQGQQVRFRPGPGLPEQTIITFQEGPWTDVLQMHGVAQTAGMETIYHEGIPVWGHVFRGVLLGAGAGKPTARMEDVLAFFRAVIEDGHRESMAPGAPFMPWGRLPAYSDGNWVHAVQVHGDITEFSGTGLVAPLKSGEAFYKYQFMGGLVL